MNTFLSRLDWRFATKQFDPDRGVSPEDIEKILEAVRNAPSSFGIQPYHVHVVHDAVLKERMHAASHGQPQVVDAPYVLVFCARTDLRERVAAYAGLASHGDPAALERMQGFLASAHGALDDRTPEEKSAWAARQAYIALGFGLAACAELGIDSCPMEGFDSGAVDVLLGLPDHMKSLAYLAIGYRAADPHHPKMRFSKEDLFTVR